MTVPSIYKQYRTLDDILGGFTGVALPIFIGFAIFATDQPDFAVSV